MGFLIHAYGDSFSHTFNNGQQLQAYGWPAGHGLDGHMPDMIAADATNYMYYVICLFDALGGDWNNAQQANQMKLVLDAAIQIEKGQVWPPPLIGHKRIDGEVQQQLITPEYEVQVLSELAKKQFKFPTGSWEPSLAGMSMDPTKETPMQGRVVEFMDKMRQQLPTRP